MHKKVVQCEFETVDGIEQLAPNDKLIFQSAIEACDKAYAPYSNFFVGAATLAEDKVYTGSNQENAAYPSGICAERSLIYWFGANFPNTSINTIAIAARENNSAYDLPVTPCGACRQALLEYEIKQKHPIRLIFRGSDKKIWISPSVSNLLPFAFTEKNLHE